MLRLRGLHLAIASIGFVFLVQIGLEHWDYAGGRLGISGMAGVEAGLVWSIVAVIGLGNALATAAPCARRNAPCGTCLISTAGHTIIIY